MKLVLDGGILSSALAAVECLIPEGTLQANSEGLRFLDMDPANVAMVNLQIPQSAFVVWDLAGKEEEIISVNFTKLKPILKRVGKDEPVELTTIDGGRLKLKFNNRTFEVPLIADSDKPKKEPALTPIYSVNVTTQNLIDLLADAGIISEAMAFVYDKDKNTLTVKSDEEQHKFESGVTIEEVKLKAEKTFQSKFALEYLTKMVKNSLGKTVTVELGEDYPLRLLFKNDNFNVRYILAPRVTD
jgi:DNA polymerase III sliding clamp (beta) subunit (PCNA family)